MASVTRNKVSAQSPRDDLSGNTAPCSSELKESENVSEYFSNEQKTSSSHAAAAEASIGSGNTHANSCWILARIERKYPRTFSLFFGVVAPLFLLICVSFLCGHFLALLEAPFEKSSNDDELASMFSRLVSEIMDTPMPMPSQPCSFDGDLTHLLEDEGCRDLLTEKIADRDKLTFNWIRCGGVMIWEDQVQYVARAWMKSWLNLMKQYLPVAENFIKAYEQATRDAQGHEVCSTNTAGGALFWFTLMTTIGYGNTSPQNTGGRTLVYTLGFISILCFTSVISHAGSICLDIFDDFALRIRAPCLTNGMVSSIFWLAMLVLWIFVIAAVSSLADLHYESDWSKALWFSYISTATVGFGDIHIAHETFRAGEMFFVPVLFLIGFVFLGNFLRKFSETVSPYVSRGPSLGERLAERREGGSAPGLP